MRKISAVLFLLLSFSPLIKADLTPAIQQFTFKDNTLLINTNTGMYQVRLEGGNIFWRQFPFHPYSGMSSLYESESGDLWGVSYNEWNSDLNMIQQFDGKAWKQYFYPSFDNKCDFRFFMYQGQSCLMVYDPSQAAIRFHRFEGDEWIEFLKAEVDFGKYLNPSTDTRYNFKLQTAGDTIRFSGITAAIRKQVLYTYTPDRGEWDIVYGKLLKNERKELFGTKKRRYKPIEDQYNNLLGIVSDTGDTLHIDIDYVLKCHTLDKDENLYVCIVDHTGDHPLASYYGCLNGKWSLLGKSNTHVAEFMAIHDGKNRLWSAANAYSPKQYVAYFDSGRWVEIEMLPEPTEGGGDEDEPEPEEGVYQATSHDDNNYVSVRSEPNENAPIVSLLLSRIDFTAKDMADGWSQVWLHSGLTGYVRSPDIYAIYR